MVEANSPGVTLTPVKGCLVATLHADLNASSFEQIRFATLQMVQQKSITAVIFDLSAVRILDQHEFEQLRQISEMLRLMGIRTMLVGLSAGLVAYAVGSDVDMSGMETQRGLQEALEHLLPGHLGGY